METKVEVLLRIQITKDYDIRKNDIFRHTVLPLAPVVVIREMQFFGKGFNKPAVNKCLSIWEPSLVSLFVNLFFIFMSKAAVADSLSLHMTFSISNCSSSGPKESEQKEKTISITYEHKDAM